MELGEAHGGVERSTRGNILKYEEIYQDEEWLNSRPCVQNMDREFREAIKYASYVSTQLALPRERKLDDPEEQT